MLVTLEIPSKDKSYHWFLNWMAYHQEVQAMQKKDATLKPKGLLARFKPGSRHLAVETRYVQHDNGSVSTHFLLVPGPGNHILNYKNTLISVERARDGKIMDLSTGTPFETVLLKTLYRDRSVFTELLAEAQDLALQQTQGKTVIYTAWGTEWRPFGPPRRKRTVESVVLDKGVKEKIVEDVSNFLKSGSWYTDRGIPYRRGYLLYGPPGSGKTSFIQALAAEFDYNICVLNLSERGLTDDRLNHLITNMPDRSIILLEDVDAAFSNRRVQTDEHGYRGANVTFSGLLNALDGVASSEERIVFLTTNWRGRLDHALIRPGRVDLSVELGWATRYQVETMWERFYGDGAFEGVPVDGLDVEAKIREGKELKPVFINRLKELGLLPEDGKSHVQISPEDTGPVPTEEEIRERGGRVNGVSTAQLQGLFVFNKGDPQGALRGLDEFMVEGK
ncbi:hypothetical protein BJ508DRAFT_413540 [Ascobolus immersus RN42]|uniref:P-loop containing nucleoside triphosphate hydrolase protein n=1 Tax=Ascobolus immersus RN42 TaxID=1160509 RepID=A0A3N4IGN7_ASCIM|nr:hypothetical protein BJ508DRAFT_413540 [Ascobolus immersus RN42]